MLKNFPLALPLMVALALSPIAFGGETTTNANPNASVTTQTNAVKQEKVSNIVVTTNTNITIQTNMISKGKVTNIIVTTNTNVTIQTNVVEQAKTTNVTTNTNVTAQTNAVKQEKKHQPLIPRSNH